MRQLHIIIWYFHLVYLQVDLIYRDKSVGNLIRVSVVKLILLKDHETFASSSRSGGSGSVSASDMLKTFCKWQGQLTTDKTFYDVALLLTRFGLEDCLTTSVLPTPFKGEYLS